MILRLRWRLAGAHVRVVVSAGPDVDHLAHCGVLTFRPDEWQTVKTLLEEVQVDARSLEPEVQVVEDGAEPESPAGWPPPGPYRFV